MIDLTALVLLLAALLSAPADLPALLVDKVETESGSVETLRAFRTDDGFVVWADDVGMRFRKKGEGGAFEFFEENGKEADFVRIEMKEVLGQLKGAWEKRTVKLKDGECAFTKRDDHVYATSKQVEVLAVRPGRLEAHRGKLTVKEAPETKSVEGYLGDDIRVTEEDSKVVHLRVSDVATVEDLKKLEGKTVEVSGYVDVDEFPGNHGQAYPQDPAGKPVERPRRLVIRAIKPVEDPK